MKVAIRTCIEERRTTRKSDAVAVFGSVDEVVEAVLLLGLVVQLSFRFSSPELSLLLSGSESVSSPGTYSASLSMSLSLDSLDFEADEVSEGGGGGLLGALGFVTRFLL